MPRKAIIIGAGPAGLTAAYELLKRTDIVPIILEKSGDIGGISKTVNYKGNRIDIGGHRFFSKSDRVMEWWLNIMPIQPLEERQCTVTYHKKSRTIITEGSFPKLSENEQPDKVMLVRKRLSRIYFLRTLFSYPIQLSLDTLKKLGLSRTVRILTSYLKARLTPRKPEKSLEDFFINRFGEKLYKLFFKDYTEKVWGVPCVKISAEWGAQRIKGISIAKALAHAVKSLKPKTLSRKGDIAQKDTETSLIENFLYPKLGPGQLWEEVACQIQQMGGKVYLNQNVKHISMGEKSIQTVTTVDSDTGQAKIWEGDYFFSTMPVKELIGGMRGEVPDQVKEIAAGLQYRDFITVGVLLSQLLPPGEKEDGNRPRILPDTWVYIQEKDIKVGRLQIFNNWSPFMVKDASTVWIGMEYFCNTTDAFWNLSDTDIQASAINELEKMGLAKIDDVLDSTVLRVEKTYPAYFGTYDQFHVIRQFTEQFSNLFLIGRNGMHKYNNSDHSMLTAMVSVDNIIKEIPGKENIWAINTENEYHEEKTSTKDISTTPVGESPKPTTAPKSAEVEEKGSFKEYLTKNRLNKIYLCSAAIAVLLQLVVFKYFYPYASFIDGDSYIYLRMAFQNSDISTYPIGYAKFLRLFSVFSQSDTVLVAFQYLLLQASILWYLFTFFYFYNPSKSVRIMSLAFLVLNPAFFYISNYVSSDSLFISLSLIWFTLLLWIIHRPSTRLVILQGLIIFLAFTIRYNALFYPLITCLSFILSKQRVFVKLAGTGLGIFLIGCFMANTSSRYFELTGIHQFSPFSGWQIANNALYAYRYIDSSEVKPAPTRFRQLDMTVRAYFDTTRDLKKHPEETLLANTMYMWDSRSPLVHYMQDRFKKDSGSETLKNWATMGPLYADYGSYLIRKYPSTFIKYYLWPNALKYYAPPIEFLSLYNTGRDTVYPIAQMWFGYKTTKLKSRVQDFNVRMLNFYPILTGVLNVVFICSILAFIFLQGYKQHPRLWKGLLLVGGFWLVNFGFSVFASPIALRFQLFPIVIYISYASLLIEFLIISARQPELEGKIQVQNNFTMVG